MKKFLLVLSLALVLFAGASVAVPDTATAQAARHFRMRVYSDSNFNAVKDAGEPWVNGVNLRGDYSVGCTGSWLDTGIKTTDADGYAVLLEGVPDGVSVCFQRIRFVAEWRCWTSGPDGSPGSYKYFGFGAGTIGSFWFEKGVRSTGCP